ncbi:hypothetical protein CEQ90_20470 [Lewinellaceae bacterium SD302]|nr:hypothetical protein CEQ90_20470 [Lewinellaceae bacterium SD302]
MAIFSNIYCHQDRYYSFNEDNVVVRIKTGFDYEEIRKAEMLSLMISDLAKQMKYPGKIQLDFIHDYVYRLNRSDKFVSYKRSDIIQNNGDKYLSRNINNAGLIIRNVNTEVNFEELLKFVEASINYEAYIKTNQIQYKYDGGHNQWIIYSISQDQISYIIENTDFKHTLSILSCKYYRGNNGRKSKYFYQDGIYNFITYENGFEEIVLKTNNLYQYKALENHSIIVEKPCKIYIVYSNGLHLLKDSVNCDGVYRLLEFRECSSEILNLKYWSRSSDTIPYFPDLIKYQINPKLGVTDEADTFDCG